MRSGDGNDYVSSASPIVSARLSRLFMPQPSSANTGESSASRAGEPWANLPLNVVLQAADGRIAAEATAGRRP